ncbi:MAG: cysteine desulfurase [Clostridiaceae bacterium]|nr:cysteine desulfurase [Clostridiaceae bacterium]
MKLIDMQNNAIYLDYAAASPICTDVLDNYCSDLRDIYANPASSHFAGHNALAMIEDARSILAQVFKANPADLIFTSGGTESINLALKGLAGAYTRLPKRILITAGEHEATRKVAASIHYDLTEISLDPISCAVDKKALLDAIEDQNPGIVSLILVSNETGAVTPIADIVTSIRKLSPRTKIHLDAVQAAGKIPLNFTEFDCDLMSISGHKFGSPKGIGLLIKKPKTILEPLILGGGQQSGFRSGTENAPLVKALATAAELADAEIEENYRKCKSYREQFIFKLSELTDEFRIVSPANGVPQILLLSFPRLRGETLVNAVSNQGVYISHGSACSGLHGKENITLRNLGLTDQEVLGAVRISFSKYLSSKDVIKAAQIIGTEYLRWRL